jgi:dTDP-4-dehydrorhamnose 3,5-epimerase
LTYVETPLRGAFLIEPNSFHDDRGFFSRLLCIDECMHHIGKEIHIKQINNSSSLKKGTLRGIHYQNNPSCETKIVRCVKGSLWDVIVDVRAGSETFGKCYGVELSSTNRKVLVVPEGFGHGIVTLEDDTEVIYFVTANYNPASEMGINFNDPALEIDLPLQPIHYSIKDQNWPPFSFSTHAVEIS